MPPMGRAFNMCGAVAAPNLYAVAQQHCLQAPDTRMTIMGRRSGSSSSNNDVERAAAYGSQANIRMVQDRDKTDPVRRWGFVFAIARTWKTVEEKTIKNLVTHVPHTYSQRTRVPREHARKSRQTFWTYHTCVCLRHVGDVTVVLSKKGRNLGPKQTKILVTTLAELTPSQVVCIDKKRWAVELMHWAL